MTLRISMFEFEFMRLAFATGAIVGLLTLSKVHDRELAWVAESERHAALEGASPGECLLLLHAAIARFAAQK